MCKQKVRKKGGGKPVPRAPVVYIYPPVYFAMILELSISSLMGKA